MKTTMWMALGLTLAAVLPATADGPGREFTATAVMTTSEGTRRMPVTIIVNRFTSVEEAKQLAGVLENGGQTALLAAIRTRAGGRLRLGALERPLSLVIAEPEGRGYRYVVVTARALKIHETQFSEDSLDYPFGVAVFEVGDFGKGSGDLYPAAALWVDSEGKVDVEQYDADPGQLLDIKKVR